MSPSRPIAARFPAPFPAAFAASFPVGLALALAAVSAGAASAQVAREPVDPAVVRRIREEGLERSYIEGLARWLTEVNGPRLTGSPGLKRAEEWAAGQLRGWGLENVRIEPWGEFGRGWQAEAYAGRILTPFEQPLHAQPLAWTGSTPGTVHGHALVVEVAALPDVERYRGRMKDAFLLLDAPQGTPPEFEHIERRTPLADLLAPPRPAAAVTPVPEAERQAMMARLQALRDAQRSLLEAALEEGAYAILRISSRSGGVIRGGPGGSRTKGDPEGLPHIALPREQYNEIWRNVETGIPVELELMVESRFLEDDLSAANTLADLPGTDKAEEYVMLGAHLDSWHMGEGATDNAAGVVVMMEAMRILKSLDLKPRRTIRIALWSAEEQGLLGSRAWVANHPELAGRISAYLNLDNGTGRIRGIWDQSNEKAIPVLERIFEPLRDLGVVAVRHGDTGGSDHLAFDAAGVPGFNFIQDPIEYGINTHHTELDTFDHLVLEDLEQAAVVVASTVYALAMREEMMPRKEPPPIPE